MTLCEDDATLTGSAAMFLGIETATWNVQQFIDAANFCKQHKITTLFIKVFEVGSSAGDATGIWYGGINGVDAIYNAVQPIVNVIPYGFLYGDTWGTLTFEIANSKLILQRYGKLCLDMEQKYWANSNSANWAQQIASAIAPVPGKLWVSCPADPVQNNQLAFLQAMSPATNVYMPMVYSDYLSTTWQADFQQVNPSACLQPTIDLSAEFGPNSQQNIIADFKRKGVLAFSVWEYKFAVTNAALLDQLVQEFTGGTNVSIITHNGCILDLQKSYQLDGGSQDKCGPWSVSELKYAGLPGKGPTGTASQVQQWASAEYTKWIGPDVVSDQNGSSIDNMHQFLRDAGLHWWDIAGINPTSKQSDDIARLHRASDSGFPVLVTVNELSVKRPDGSNPYPWQPALGPVNHIFTVVGHAVVNGVPCLLVDDELNNSDNWPDAYREDSIECHWASTIQVVGPDVNNPWLKSIPGEDPLLWPAGFNAQNFAAPIPIPTPPPAVDSQLVAAQNEWNALGYGGPFDTGIAKAWYSDYLAGHYHGPATSGEQNTIRPNDGVSIIIKYFAGGSFTWDGAAHWHPFS